MTTAISRTSSEAENLEGSAIYFLEATVSVPYISATFELVVQSRLKMCWSHGPWEVEW